MTGAVGAPVKAAWNGRIRGGAALAVGTEVRPMINTGRRTIFSSFHRAAGKRMESAAVTASSSIFSLQPVIGITSRRSSNFLSLSSLTSFSSPLSTSFPGLCSLGNSVSLINRTLCTASRSSMESELPVPPLQRAESFFRNVLANMEKVYLDRNPTAKSVLELVQSADDDRICYDHIAFRTFGVNGYGIDSMAQFFLDFGYTSREELRFPAKKLRALWFSPPRISHADTGSGAHGPLPRIFISELLVDEMSLQAQEIIKKYTEISGSGNRHAALASALGFLTWEKPLYSEFKQLARESEYAAWTLVNGYAVNHVTISTHRLKSHLRNIKMLNRFIEENGFKLNSEGGVLKVSPDGLLLQSSTVADSFSFQFSDGVTESVPCSYIEFAERLVLPQYKNLLDEEVRESHRRDGFEVGNADKIFESTSLDQLTRRAA